jgi:hypothetical protein
MRLAQRIPRGLWFGLLLASNLVAGPVLHEKFAPDPAEDLRLGATTPSGSMPAAIQTRSGVVAAPEEGQGSNSKDGTTYGGAQTPNSVDANYHVDKLTTRPNRVQYDEPFRPSILPFKRLFAFDALGGDMSLFVGERKLEPLSVGGLADESEDVFFADFEVDLVAEVPVRIPTVGPGARVRALNLDPPGPVKILRDGADNWFARADRGGRVRFVMQISVERRSFGSQFSVTNWHHLSRHLHPLPTTALEIATEVLGHIGVDQSFSPARALVTLVEYFRGFRESAELPIAENPEELYRELSFSQKGVCRHRAYAFTVTALALGLPTRLVHNEAHAWVEVFDSEIWHRVDLGGAAANIQETNPDPLIPDHLPPHDPYLWPSGANSGLSAAAGSRLGALTARSNPGRPGSNQSTSATSVDVPQAGPSASQAANLPSSTPGAVPYNITLVLDTKRLLRGRPLSVKGQARRGEIPCVLSRVDIFVEGDGAAIGIGSVATNRNGEFIGQVTLPRTTQVGPLRVTARVAGGCNQ